MKRVIVLIFSVVGCLSLCAAWLYGGTRTPQADQRFDLHDSRAAILSLAEASSSGILSAIQKEASFHIYFPTQLPLGYKFYYAGSGSRDGVHIYYGIITPSGTLVSVNEKPSGASVAGFLSADTLPSSSESSVVPVTFGSHSGFVYTTTKGFTDHNRNALTVLVFTGDGVDVNVGSLDLVDVQKLIQVIDSME